MTDQHRHDWMGYVDPQFETPNLDALAASGVRFDAGYSAATVCVPARTSLLTGLHHHRVPEEGGGVGGDASRSLQQGFWTIARELSSRGWDTALIGRMHFDPVHSDHGFDTMRMCENTSPGSGYVEGTHLDDYGAWLAEEGRPDWRLVEPDGEGGVVPYLAVAPRVFPDDAEHHSTSWIRDEAIRYLRDRDRDRPMLLVVSFPHPHAPYDPPEPYASMYDPSTTVVPELDEEANDGFPQPFSSDFDEQWVLHRSASDDSLARNVLTAIRGLVRQIDDAVGDIVTELDLDRSLVMFTADHGDYGGNRGLLGKAPWFPLDDLIRVPLFVAGGAVAGAPRVSAARVQNASFVPTCLDYAGVDLDPGLFDFPSLRPLLDGDGATDAGTDAAMFASVSSGYPMVLEGRYKAIYHGLTGKVVVFDLEDDPDERRPLPDQHPAHARMLELAQRDLAWGPADEFFMPRHLRNDPPRP